MEHFTPLTAGIGGALIGLSAAILWLGNGRIAGISGIFGQLLPPHSTVVWRLVFLAFMILGAFAGAYLIPGLGVGGPAGKPATLVTAPAWFAPGTITWLAAAGLLTGFGTKIGNGCTSGHGIVGIARLSRRSFAAVATFFVVAIVVVTVTGVV